MNTKRGDSYSRRLTCWKKVTIRDVPDSCCSQCLPTWWLEWQFSVVGWGPPQTHHTGSLSHHIHRRCRGLCQLQEKTPLNTTSFCLGSPGLFVSYRKVWTHTDRAYNLLLRDKASQLCPPVLLALSFFYNLNLFFFFWHGYFPKLFSTWKMVVANLCWSIRPSVLSALFLGN